MSEFASRWPDMRLWAINRIRAEIPDAKVSAERDEGAARQIVVDVTPAQMSTPVSRMFMVNVEAWDAAGKAQAFALCGDAMFALESAPRNANPVVTTETSSGPNERRDSDSGAYSYDGDVNITAHRA